MNCKKRSFPALTFLLTFLVTMIIPPAVSVTWEENITRLTTYTYFDGLPAVTQTRDGRVWIVWSKATYSGDLGLYYRTSSDLGATWSSEKNLTDADAPGHNTSPSILQTENGTIWVVWSSNKQPSPPPTEPDFSIDADPKNLTIQLGGSDNSTIIITSLRNFSDPVDLSVKSTIFGVSTTLDPTQVTPPPNGTANSTLTVFVETTADPGNYTLTVVGKSGDLSHRVDINLEITESSTGTLSSTSSSSSISTSSAEEDDYEIFYKTSNDNGATWSYSIQLTNNTVDDFSPSIVQLKNGTIIIVWQSTIAGNTDIYYKSTSNGISWTNEKRLTTDPSLDKGPSIIQAKDERIWVVWSSNRTGDFEIFYKTYNGLSWSNAFRLTNSTNSDACPSILQTIDETIWIFWSSIELSPTATGDIYYKFSLDNGATWSDRVQFTTDPYEDVWPSLTQAHNTGIWVVWTSDRADQPDGNWDIYFRTSLVGDVNEDGVVDIWDLSIVGKAYGSLKGEPEYTPEADINKDQIVDMRDIQLVARNYGKT